MPTGYQIPHFGLKRQYKVLKDELLAATDLALRDGELINGHYTRSFEEWLKFKTKTRYAITVHSGTQALYIIAKFRSDKHVRSYGRKPTIRLPNLTYPATLTAFLSADWDIIIDDTDKYGILLKNESHEPSTNLMHCLVGLYGRIPWKDTTYSYDIVDGAQHWLVANGQVGYGMAISFDPTKNLPSSGNGGAIVTNDADLYNYAVAYRNNGKETGFQLVGTNSKMSEQDCAHLLVRAKYIDLWQARRSIISSYYYERLCDLPIMILNDDRGYHANQKFVIYSDRRNTIHTNLLLDGIETRIHYEYTLGELPIARNIPKPDMLSTSVMLARGVLSLPIYPELTDTEVDHVVDKIRSLFRE